MTEKSFLGLKHTSVHRDYLSRVTDTELPKHLAGEIAKKWGREYWDGDRRTGYGGYHYIPGYWKPLAERLIAEYDLTSSSKVLDVGCGKGFLLAELLALLPGICVQGIDISSYAVEHSHTSVRSAIQTGTCTLLPFDSNEFDLAISLNVFHNLTAPELELALVEFKRVSKKSYLVVETYGNEAQKANLLYWQLTCEAFLRPEEWRWWFNLVGYDRDFEFIVFD